MVETMTRKFRCMNCNHEWQAPFGTGRQLVCPRCGAMRIHRTNPGVIPPGRRCKRRKGLGWREETD